MKINRFEDAEVWCMSRDLAGKIYQESFSGDISRDFSFRDQLRRTAVSIMANIAEGFERQSKKELIRFLYIAKGSAGELRSHLYLTGDIGYLEEKNVNDLMSHVLKISKSLSGFIKYLQNN